MTRLEPAVEYDGEEEAMIREQIPHWVRTARQVRRLHIPDPLDESIAWCHRESEGRTSPVESYPPQYRPLCGFCLKRWRSHGRTVEVDESTLDNRSSQN